MMPPVASSMTIWAGLDEREREHVMAEASKELAHRFEVYKKALFEASPMRMPPPAERMAMLTARPPEVWAILRALDPKAYQRDLDDFRKLTEKALNETVRAG